MTWIIYEYVWAEKISKGMIVRDGNLNARERYGRLGVHIASDGLIGGRSCSGGYSPSY